MSISLSSLSLRQSGRLPKVDFLKMWHPRPLFCSFLVFFKQTLQNLQQINEKNVRRVSGAGIRTLIMSLLLKHAEHCVKLWRFEIFKNGIQPNSPLKNIIKDFGWILLKSGKKGQKRKKHFPTISSYFRGSLQRKPFFSLVFPSHTL